MTPNDDHEGEQEQQAGEKPSIHEWGDSGVGVKTNSIEWRGRHPLIGAGRRGIQA